MNVIVYGYYGMHNFGDDLFEYIFTKVFTTKHHNILIKSPDTLKFIPDNTDVMICGGGDIVNDYFMNKVVRLKAKWEKKNKKHLPTYAISIGLSYPEQIVAGNIHYLDIFDHYIVRNKHDYNLLANRYGKKHVQYLYDLAFLLPFYNLYKIVRTTTKVGIFLARPIYKNGTNKQYNNFIDQMAKLIDILSQNYIIELVACDQGNSNNNNDIYINNDVYNKLKCQSNVTIVDASTHEQISELFSTYKFTICMRFHSHILSYITRTPFVSLSMTNKVKYFMNDNNLNDYIVSFKKEDGDIFIDDFSQVYQKIEMIDKFPSYDIQYVSPEYYIKKVNEKKIRHTPPFYFSENTLNEKQQLVINSLVNILQKYRFEKDAVQINPSKKEIDTCVTVDDLCFLILGEHPCWNNNRLKNILGSTIDFLMTNKYESDYSWGLNEQIFDLNVKESVKWIMHHMYYYKVTKNDRHIETHDYEHKIRKFSVNMNYIEPHSMDGFHRAGWKYVTDALFDEFHSDKSDIILDVCVDATFHWNHDILKLIDKIPYRQKWIGIIHHTPNTGYTDYNTTALINNPTFIESLSCCVCLIVLSQYLKTWFETEFKKKNINTKIIALVHPTEFTINNFSLETFLTNEKKMVVQIGGWMRNSYAIYALPIDHTKLDIKKAFLKGKMMENYFKPDSFNIEELVQIYELNENMKEQKKHHHNIICHDMSISCHPSVGMTTHRNKYIQGMIEQIINDYNSVIEINRLCNDDYDIMLTKNIVFLNLVEASACNTLIECIVRNVPIIINKLPAVVELLGDTYPLYYNTMAEAGEIVTNVKKIIAAHIYLCKLDKTNLNINYFLDDFEMNCFRSIK